MKNPFKKWKVISDEKLKGIVDEAVDGAARGIQNMYFEMNRMKKDNPDAIERVINYHRFGEGNKVPFRMTKETMTFWNDMGWFSFNEEDINKAESEFKGKKTKEAAAGPNKWAYNASSISSRAQSSVVLRNTQNAAYAKYHLDPHINSAVENYKNYILGTGVKLFIPNDAVSKFVAPFWKACIQKNQRRFIHSMMIDGEYFWLIVKVGETLMVSKIYPSEISEIVLDDDNRDLIKSFKVHWTKSDGTHEIKEIDNVEYPGFSFKSKKKGILFTKWSDGDETRGVVPIETALRPARWAEDFIVDRVILNHERSRIVWFKKYKQFTTDVALTGKSYPIVDRAPGAGTMVPVPPNIDYEAVAANINASDVKEDYMAILYLLAAATRQPMDILTQRANEQVYASIKRSANAFHQNILTSRERSAASFKALIETQIRFGLDRKILPKRIRIPKILVEMNNGLDEIDPEKIQKMLDQKVTIDTEEIFDYMVFIFPNVFTENGLEDTKALVLQKKCGVISSETMANKLGLDPKYEIVRSLQYAAIEAELMGDDEEDTADLKVGDSETN